MQPVVLRWQVASFHGWGVYGLNLALSWAAGDSDIEPACALPIQPEMVFLDPIHRLALQPFVTRSERLQAQLQASANGRVKLNVPILFGLGAEFETKPAAHNVMLDGQPSIGVVFFEGPLSAEAVERAKRLDAVIAGSSWNQRVLESYGIRHARTVLQGINPSYFHARTRSRPLADRFLIFSGGKAELRKGQDIVLAAFKIFSERHPEAMLITAWHNAWPASIRTLDQSRIAPPVSLTPSGEINVIEWSKAAGIPAGKVIDLGFVPNMLMPSILSTVDVAVFPNRAEGGTNLVAMECMACGIPVILSKNTGHLDLIEDGNCYLLEKQRQSPAGWPGNNDVSGWGESSVEELVARMEEVFSNPEEGARRGARAAQFMSRLTWAKTAQKTRDVILDLRRSNTS
jgi:glycosyltransferase involved in cell wall biosynthesis